jgi:galactose oxidase
MTLRTPVPQRPTLQSIDKLKVPYIVGQKIIITTDIEVDTTASLIRCSAVTHALNNDLRRIKLTLKLEGNLGAGRRYSAEIPSDPGLALPGYWMLFVLKGGVPGHAATVQILAQ